MEDLLPKLSEIKPITGDWKTFSDCPYNCEWDKLTFNQKLQTVCDLVRQTMLYKENPSAEEEQKLIGDSLTAAMISMMYLKENNLGKNYRLALARKRFYEIDSALSNHIVLLVDDENNKTYFFDATPFIGYGYGKVCHYDTQKFYDEIIALSNSDISTIRTIRSYNNKLMNGTINSTELKILKEMICDENSYIFKGYFQDTKDLLGNNVKTNNLNFPVWNDLKNSWQKELRDLIESDSDYSRQIEIMQTLESEKTKYNKSSIKYANLENILYPLTYLSPRFFYDRGLTMILIKPSSYLLGISSTVRDIFLNKGNGAIGEYDINMGLKSKDYGMKIMHNFHPHGYKYERSMNGPNDIFLIKEAPDEVGIIKKQIRQTYGKYINNHSVNWFDGKPIIWDPIITNLVHSTDDSSETAMHYVAPFPECQLMTRFMYPNPKLKIIKK